MRTYRSAITWTSTSETASERVFLLKTPLRDAEPAKDQAVYTAQSLDRKVIETFTVSSGAHELVGTVRYSDDPQGLLDMLDAGARNLNLTYIPELNDPGTAYTCKLVAPRGGLQVGPDPDTGQIGEHAVEVRLRKTDQTPFQAAYSGTDVLFRYVAGGDLSQATVARADTATYAAKGYGTVTTAQNNIGRIHWLDLDADGVRETPVLLTEGASSNRIAESEDFTAWTTASGTPTITAGATDPAGGSGAYTLEDDDGTNREAIRITASYTGSDGERVASIFLKAGTAPETTLLVYDSTAATVRHRVLVTWTNGVPSLSTDTGTGDLFAVEEWSEGFYRLAFSADGVLVASVNQMWIYIAGFTVSNTGTVIAYGADAENLVFPTSYKPTAGATNDRITDRFSWTVPGRPQALTMYARFIELGSILTTNAGVLHLGTVNATTAPRFTIREASGVYQAIHTTANGSVTSALAAAPSYGDRVELRAVLNADGSCQLHQSIAEAAETSASASSALALAQSWSASTIQLNGGDADGFAGFRNVAVVRGVHSLATMRRYAGVS